MLTAGEVSSEMETIHGFSQPLKCVEIVAASKEMSRVWCGNSGAWNVIKGILHLRK